MTWSNDFWVLKILTNSVKNSNRELHKLIIDHRNWPTMIYLQIPLNSLINLNENSKCHRMECCFITNEFIHEIPTQLFHIRITSNNFTEILDHFITIEMFAFGHIQPSQITCNIFSKSREQPARANEKANHQKKMECTKMECTKKCRRFRNQCNAITE